MSVAVTGPKANQGMTGEYKPPEKYVHPATATSVLVHRYTLAATV